MTIRPILIHPEPKLRKKALPVKDKLVDYMNRGSPVIRRVAIDTLANIGEEADDVIPA